jgi:hypothetical protein
MGYVEKYCRAWQATDHNMMRGHCMLDTWDYKHSEYVILIVFPLQQWLREHVSMLHYMYTDCHVYLHISLLLLLQVHHYLSQEIRQQDRKKVSFVKNIIRKME